MMSKKLLLCLGLALLAVGATASQDHVVHLTESDFEEKVGDGKVRARSFSQLHGFSITKFQADLVCFSFPPQVYFIKFFAPWCGHCKKMAPTWAELASDLSSTDDIVIASVDCTVHRPVCDKAGIKGFPTLKIYQGGEAKEKYTGARTLDDFKNYVTSQHKLLLEETTA
jgi:protein disulfide-isomerase-like protein